ncbi:Uncharacterised protein [Mycobacteroides abscessus subsp. abscessus]|nr:Uncharacterised protein [Mycobacteroides abscessus subsp. abscessus]SHW00736.1 Uncharacterised protein [Mycobacteroides abscessus subsp. abscessus]SHX31409.1 Uncharacterised protein [Mycobacteroides abscessus subsp. abscessus]SHX86915.1 Uncharacterised protein [Mycobacteroides abscessus subsp. abscessus]SHZ38376.1 Uncharacterised protein [Mycobacteroides abscessus subsp. abscessus]
MVKRRAIRWLTTKKELGDTTSPPPTPFSALMV